MNHRKTDSMVEQVKVVDETWWSHHSEVATFPNTGGCRTPEEVDSTGSRLLTAGISGLSCELYESWRDLEAGPGITWCVEYSMNEKESQGLYTLRYGLSQSPQVCLFGEGQNQCLQYAPPGTNCLLCFGTSVVHREVQNPKLRSRKGARRIWVSPFPFFMILAWFTKPASAVVSPEDYHASSEGYIS